MKFSSVLTACAFAVSSAQAAASSDVQFLTALVSDYDNNKKQYFSFIRTAKDVPPDLTSLARDVVTYKDNSYTTLLDDSKINVASLRSFATELPWYSRLAGAAGVPAGLGLGSVTLSALGSKLSSKSESKSESKSSSSSSSKLSSSKSTGVGSAATAPVCALLGAAALILM